MTKPAAQIEALLSEIIEVAGANPVEARTVDPRAWRTAMIYATNLANLSTQNLLLRHLLCGVVCLDTAYRENGEASDNSVNPPIDFLRDDPLDIRDKLLERRFRKTT